MAVDGKGATGGRQLRLLNDARHTVAILQTRFRGLGGHGRMGKHLAPATMDFWETSQNGKLLFLGGKLGCFMQNVRSKKQILNMDTGHNILEYGI